MREKKRTNDWLKPWYSTRDVNNTANILCESVKIYARMRSTFACAHTTHNTLDWHSIPLRRDSQRKYAHVNRTYLNEKYHSFFDDLWHFHKFLSSITFQYFAGKKCNELKMQPVYATAAAFAMRSTHSLTAMS